MTRARQELISLDATPYYHCVCRCVRRAFLCGEDHVTGASFEHRKQWVVDRLQTLTEIFALQVTAYAVMSNHYHVILYVDALQAREWGEREVLERWRQLFKGPLLVERYLAGEALGVAERQMITTIADEWRRRLADLSWFMRCLNEYIARKANEEDQCKGRFWEGRFRSQALLDEQALLTCMAYVDLNPVRAGISPTPESSDYTSIQARLDPSRPCSRNGFLRPFTENESSTSPEGIAFCWQDYLALVDWTGRAVRDDKRGAIASGAPPILQRLGIEPREFIRQMKQSDTGFADVVGCVHRVRRVAEQLGRKFLKGTTAAQRLYVVSAHPPLSPSKFPIRRLERQ